MIHTIALTVLMPATAVIPTNPVRLPGPAMPININQSIRLPGPVMPGGDLELPGPSDRNAPPPRIKLDIPQSVNKKAPSAIDTLRKLVKDDRPDFAKSAFDHIALPQGEMGATPVYVGR